MLDNQMNKMFAEGGVMQEGGTVDPVSGNDVPPGAMAEEVRDDIDAKLSEGEFVIPADVVRYIGLEKLMMMRDKAKAGLKRMSEIGQMGNAEEVDDAEALHSDEDEMDDETFSSEIDSIMNEENNQEYAKGGDVRKYAPGGYVGGTENAERYKNAPLSGFEMVVMTNDAGQTMYIPHVNGKPLLPVPAGYRTKSTAASESTTPVITPVVDSAGGAGGAGGASGDAGGNSSNNSNAPGVQGSFSPVSSQTVGLAATALGVMGVPGMNAAALGKGAIANAINAIGLNSTISSNMNAVAAMMGLDASNPSHAAAISAAIDSTPNIGEVTGPTATVGESGTGGSAASAASSAAAAASAAGHSAEAIGAASQAAADATVSGADAAAAASAGAAAAAAADNGNAAEGGNTAANAAAASAGGDSSGVGDSGAGAGTGNAMAKGGFVSKKNTKTVSKPKGLAGRRD